MMSWSRCTTFAVLCGASVFAFAQSSSATMGADAARGVLRASQEAVLASTISTRVTSMPYREGDRFAKGATLVAFDCSRLKAEHNAALASQAAEARNAQMQAELLRVQATGKADLDIALERERERAAQAQAIAQHMRGCSVLAPFAGRVVETYARAHETPPGNEKLLRIVSDGPLELHVVVPSRWLTWLKPGADFDVKVDETGDVVRAVVQRVSAAVDPVSQTVKIIATVHKAPALVLPGMSGSVALVGKGADKPVPVPSPAIPVPAAAAPKTPAKSMVGATARSERF